MNAHLPLGLLGDFLGEHRKVNAEVFAIPMLGGDANALLQMIFHGWRESAKPLFLPQGGEPFHQGCRLHRNSVSFMHWRKTPGGTNRRRHIFPRQPIFRTAKIFPRVWIFEGIASQQPVIQTDFAEESIQRGCLPVLALPRRKASVQCRAVVNAPDEQLCAVGGKLRAQNPFVKSFAELIEARVNHLLEIYRQHRIEWAVLIKSRRELRLLKPEPKIAVLFLETQADVRFALNLFEMMGQEICGPTRASQPGLSSDRGLVGPLLLVLLLTRPLQQACRWLR